MSDALRVLVHGTGFAGQGHATAFRNAGADVVGIVGRTPSVVNDVAGSMGIPYGGTDWEKALELLKPDIVSIATPGGAHYDAIKSAVNHGCHVFCDKPMTVDGSSARELHQLASQKQVKTAYAASFRYMPHVLHAKRLVADGAIGEPQEVECVSHFNLEKDIPFGWSHRAEQGGGRLNNNFTHKLSIVTSVIGENVLAVSGEVRDDLCKAPIVEGVHNFKTRREHIPENLDDPGLKWGQSNVEWSYCVLAQIQSDFAPQPVSVLFKHGGLHPRFNNDYIAFYGSDGAIHISGHYGGGPLHHYGKDKRWTELALPDDIVADMPRIDGDTERNWQHLIRLFVDDILGKDVPAYQTFKDGSFYQNLIDVIRENGCWVEVTHLRGSDA